MVDAIAEWYRNYQRREAAELERWQGLYELDREAYYAWMRDRNEQARALLESPVWTLTLAEWVRLSEVYAGYFLSSFWGDITDWHRSLPPNERGWRPGILMGEVAIYYWYRVLMPKWIADGHAINPQAIADWNGLAGAT